MLSRNGISIRFIGERWRHVVRGHPEMDGLQQQVLETISSPDFIQKGDFGELLAIKLYLDTLSVRSF